MGKSFCKSQHSLQNDVGASHLITLFWVHVRQCKGGYWNLDHAHKFVNLQIPMPSSDQIRKKSISPFGQWPQFLPYVTHVGGLKHELYFSIQLGMSSSQLTNSIIFQRGWLKPPTSIVHISHHITTQKPTIIIIVIIIITTIITIIMGINHRPENQLPMFHVTASFTKDHGQWRQHLGALGLGSRRGLDGGRLWCGR